MVEAFSTFQQLRGLKELNGFLLSFKKKMELDGN
jgi:hypothetical protein